MSEELIAEVTVPGEPVSKSRPRLVRGSVYTPPKTVAAEKRFGWAFREAGVIRNDHDDLGVRVVFRAATRQRRDIDNCIKLVLDSANGIVWKDDMQVVHIEADMHRGVDEPSTTIQVWVVEARERFCEACGTTLRIQQERFCSKDCYDLKQRRGAYRKCKGCGKDVYRQQGKAQARTVYCTPECRAQRHGTCRQCGTRIAAPPSQPKAFCGPPCSSAWYRANHVVRKAGGTCSCGAPVARRAKRCRACFYSSQGTAS